MNGLQLIKQIPIDLGQRSVAEHTKGKQIALALVPDGHGKRALDVGAREGHQTRRLESRGYEVTSIDVEPQFASCHRVDANERLPFEDGHFDLVWCSEVIEHLVEPARALAELRRVTKRGGVLLLTTPNSYALLFRFIAVFGLTPQRIQRKDHLHFFDIQDIRKLAPEAELFGYFPYALVKLTIRRGVGTLSPTFVMRIVKQ
jgi:2-polyprenyl-3-methyl-5-hydroxy-6-metoxy-1,4-benzoquinol methylase